MRDIYFYKVLAVLSSVLEIGSIFLLLKSQYNLESVICVGIAYQSGNLVSTLIPKNQFTKNSTLISGFLLILFCSNNIIFFSIGASLISIGLQLSRRIITDNLTNKVTTFEKRILRVFGFVICGIIDYHSFILALVVVVIVGILANNTNIAESTHSNKKATKYDFAYFLMIIHQIHYFLYCYVICYLLFVTTGKFAGLGFAIGWISYSFAKKCFQNYNDFLVIILGHLSVSIILLILSQFYLETGVLLSLWFLSGFGGGTVYVIRKMSESSEKMDEAEDIGHFLGSVFCLILILITESISIVFTGASFFALFTAIMVFISKNKVYEN